MRPCDPQQLYVATELGVFASDDGGATWLPSNTGLAHTIVETLDFKNDHTLVAFTHGRGAFLTSLGLCPGEILGDLDGDGDVDLADLAQLLAHYGMPSGATYEDGDLDGDGDVDLADLAALLGVYGTTCE